MSQFPTSITDKIFVIKIPRPFDAAMADAFAGESVSWVLQPADLFVLDFSGHEKLSPHSYRVVVVLHQILAKNNRHLVCLGLNAQLKQQLMMDGISGAFSPVASIDEAKSKFRLAPEKPKPKTIESAFINPFIEATIKTLSIQAGTQSHVGKPFLKQPDDKGALVVDIAGVISLASDKFKGNITISFPEKVFLQIYENMFGEKQETITSEMQDAAAEILNIIYGGAKTVLNRLQGYDFKPSLPTVLSGQKLNIRHQSTAATIVLPFETTAGPFQLEVTIENH